MAKKKSKVKLSPKGIARWPWIQKPDTQFDENGVYRIELEVDPTDDTIKSWLKELKKAAVDEFGTGANLPFKKHKDFDTGQPTGTYVVKFKSSYQPAVFDQYGQEIGEDTRVGGGSIVQVAYVPNLYKGFGGGLNLYLQAVQIHELSEAIKGNASSYGFEVEEMPEDEEGVPDFLNDTAPDPGDEFEPFDPATEPELEDEPKPKKKGKGKKKEPAPDDDEELGEDLDL